MKHQAIVLLLLAVAFAAGCNAKNESAVAVRRGNLSKLGFGYHAFYAEHGKAPADVKEFSDYLLAKSPDDPTTQTAIEAMQNGDIIMIWNAVLADGAENDRYKLGFESSAPRGGGYIVTGGGVVEMVTGKKFHEVPVIPVVETASTTP